MDGYFTPLGASVRVGQVWRFRSMFPD